MPSSDDPDLTVPRGKAAAVDVSTGTGSGSSDVSVGGHADVEVEVSVMRMSAVDVVTANAPGATDVSTMTTTIDNVLLGVGLDEVVVSETRPEHVNGLPELWIDPSEGEDMPPPWEGPPAVPGWYVPWKQLTQAEYDALESPDPETLYVIIGP